MLFKYKSKIRNKKLAETVIAITCTCLKFLNKIHETDPNAIANAYTIYIKAQFVKSKIKCEKGEQN